MRRILYEWSFWSGLALFLWMALMPWFSQTSAGDPSSVRIVKTSPTYAEEIRDPKGLVVTIQFNRDMDPAMQEDFVMDQRGATDEQGNPIEIQGELTWPDTKTLQFKPSTALKPHSTYQVSLFSVKTKEGESTDQVPFRLVFMTSGGGSKDTDPSITLTTLSERSQQLEQKIGRFKIWAQPAWPSLDFSMKSLYYIIYCYGDDPLTKYDL